MPIHTKKWLEHVLKIKENLPKDTTFNDVIKVAVDKWGLKLTNEKKNNNKNNNKTVNKKKKTLKRNNKKKKTLKKKRNKK